MFEVHYDILISGSASFCSCRNNKRFCVHSTVRQVTGKSHFTSELPFIPADRSQRFLTVSAQTQKPQECQTASSYSTSMRIKSLTRTFIGFYTSVTLSTLRYKGEPRHRSILYPPEIYTELYCTPPLKSSIHFHLNLEMSLWTYNQGLPNSMTKNKCTSNILN